MLALSVKGGALAKAQNFSVSAFRAAYTRTSIKQVGTMYRFVEEGGNLVFRGSPIFQQKVFQISISGTFARPLPISTLWNTGFGLGSDIPVFLWDKGVGDAVTKTLTTPLPIAMGGSPGCTAVHARIAA